VEDGVFHQRLRLAVKESGLTVSKLAEKSGVKKRTLDRWLGQNPPIPNVLEFSYVARALGYPVDYFIFGSDNPTISQNDIILLARANRWRGLLEDLGYANPLIVNSLIQAIHISANEARGIGGAENMGGLSPQAEIG